MARRFLTETQRVLNDRRATAATIRSLVAQGNGAAAYAKIGTFIIRNHNYFDSRAAGWFLSASQINGNMGSPLSVSLLKDYTFEYLKVAYRDKFGQQLTDGQIQSVSDSLRVQEIDKFLRAADSGSTWNPVDSVRADLDIAVRDLGLERYDWPGGVNALSFGVDVFTGPNPLFRNRTEFLTWSRRSQIALENAVKRMGVVNTALNNQDDLAQISSALNGVIASVKTLPAEYRNDVLGYLRSVKQIIIQHGPLTPGLNRLLVNLTTALDQIALLGDPEREILEALDVPDQPGATVVLASYLGPITSSGPVARTLVAASDTVANGDEIIITGTRYRDQAPLLNVGQVRSLSARQLVNRVVLGSDSPEILAALYAERRRRDGTYATADFVGSLVGSKLGDLIGGSNPLARVAASSVLGTITQNVAQGIAAGGFNKPFVNSQVSVASQVADGVLDDLGAEFFGQLKNAAVGSVSSLLSLELGRLLGVSGFGGELLNVGTSSIIGHALNNALSGRHLFEGLSGGGLFKAVEGVSSIPPGGLWAGAFGSFFGAKLGSLILAPNNTEGAVLSSIGSAFGSWALSAAGGQAIGGAFASIGSTLGNFLGPGVGALVGFLIGSLIGRLFGKKKPRVPTANAEIYLELMADNWSLGSVSSLNNGNRALVSNMAGAARDAVNGFITHAIGEHDRARVVNDSRESQRYGHTGNEVWFDSQQSGAWVRQYTGSSADRAVDIGAMAAIKAMKISGGDLLLKRAVLRSSSNDLASLMGDIQLAEDYSRYLVDPESINRLINLYPNSSLAAGWAITLIRAEELGLNKFTASDFYGGLRGFLDSFSLKAHALAFENIDIIWEGGPVRIRANGGANADGVFSMMPSAQNNGRDVLIDSGMGSVGYNPVWIGGTSTANDYMWGAWEWGSGRVFDDMAYEGAASGGNDIFVATQGNDALNGRTGWDWLDGQGGTDHMWGGEGNDVLLGGAGDSDHLWGEAGDDYLHGGDGAYDRVWGGAGNDTLADSQGYDDAHWGEDGDDVFLVQNASGPEWNWYDGGNGSDTLSFERFYRNPDPNQYGVSSWNWAARFPAGHFDGIAFNMNHKIDYGWTPVYGGGSYSIENTTGTRYNDYLWGDLNANVLKGLEGDDALEGGDGDDVLEGGAGADFIFGGGGSDTLSYAGSSAAVYVDMTTYVPRVGLTSGRTYDVGNDWKVQGTGDLNGDGRSDILWRRDDGMIHSWFSVGSESPGSSYFDGRVGPDWKIMGVSDFSGDGKADIIWRHDGGQLSFWVSNGAGFDDIQHYPHVGTEWTIKGSGDFNGDGKSDLFWRRTDGAISVWLSNGLNFRQGLYREGVGSEWQVKAIGDFNADGRDDLMWQDGRGVLVEWRGVGETFQEVTWVDEANPASNRLIQSGDFDGDGKSDLLFYDAQTGVASSRLSTGSGFTMGSPAGQFSLDSGYGVAAGKLVSADGPDFDGDRITDTLFRRSDGQVVAPLTRAEGTVRAFGGDAEGDTFGGMEHLRGSRFSDELKGDAGFNRLEGGAGDDVLAATHGGDIYDGGDGFDTVDFSGATDAGVGMWLGSNVDTDKTPGHGWSGMGVGSYRGVEAALGSIHGDDLRAGAGDHLLQGNGGNDYLEGGLGSDTYVFGRGDGFDSVADSNEGANAISLKGDGLNWRDIAVWGAGGNGSLVVHLWPTGEQLTVGGNFSYATDGNHNHVIKTLDIGGGSSVDISAIDWSPSGAEDNASTAIYGGQNKADIIFAYAGDDVIYAAGSYSASEQLGNIIYAGDGNDYIQSSAGDDQFIFETGNGADYLVDSGGIDTIIMGPSVSADDVIFEVKVKSTDAFGGEAADLFIGIRDHNNPLLSASQVANRIQVENGGTQFINIDYGDSRFNSVEHIRVAGQEIDLSKAGINYTISYYRTAGTGSGRGGDGPIPPLAIDLDGDGIELRSVHGSHVSTVADDGSLWRVGWLGGDDGFLALDRNGDGTIDRLNEISFTQDLEGAKSDLEGLAAYDTNKDGKLSAADARWSEFKVWQDKNQDGIGVKKELMSLEQAGVLSISLKGKATGFTSADGTDNTILATTRIEWADPKRTGLGYDVALATAQVRTDGGGKEAADRNAKAKGKTGDAIEASLLGIQTYNKEEAEAIKAKGKKSNIGEGVLGRVETFLGGTDLKKVDGLQIVGGVDAIHDKNRKDADDSAKGTKDKFADNDWTLEGSKVAGKRDTRGDDKVVKTPDLTADQLANIDVARKRLVESELNQERAVAALNSSETSATGDAKLPSPEDRHASARSKAELMRKAEARSKQAAGGAEAAGNPDTSQQMSSSQGAAAPVADAAVTRSSEEAQVGATQTGSKALADTASAQGVTLNADDAAPTEEVVYEGQIAMANARLVQALAGFGDKPLMMMASNDAATDYDGFGRAHWLTVGHQASVQRMASVG